MNARLFGVAMSRMLYTRRLKTSCANTVSKIAISPYFFKVFQVYLGAKRVYPPWLADGTGAHDITYPQEHCVVHRCSSNLNDESSQKVEE